jgi:hypothetical protein
MKDFFNDMKTLYDTRHLRKIDPFIKKWLAPECILLGTSLSEVYKTHENIKKLFDGDLRYWYDLDIKVEQESQQSFGEYELFHVPATLTYTINENERRYENYAKLIRNIVDDNLLNYSYKASKVNYILDTLLSSRPKARRNNKIEVSIHTLMKEGKGYLISFSIDKILDTTDSYYNSSQSVMNELEIEKTLLSNDKDDLIESYLKKLGYFDASYNVEDNNIFYGVGILQRNETRDHAMRRLLDDFKDAKDYQKLYEMRLQISRLQSVYLIEEYPKVIIRFFGLKYENRIEFFLPLFPNVYYLETT